MVERTAMDEGDTLKKALISLFLMLAIAMVGIPKDLKANADDSYKTYDLQQTYNSQQQAKFEELEWSRQLVAYSRLLQGKRTGQCVLALRKYFGVPRSEVSGLAKNTKINSPTGKVGAVVVFKRMSWAGHVAIQITQVDDNGNFQYFDSNGNWGQRGAVRTININDRRISGYRIINYGKV